MSGLTPEDKLRIREEEELRFKTRQNLKMKREWKALGCLVVGGLIVFFILKLVLSGSSDAGGPSF